VDVVKPGRSALFALVLAACSSSSATTVLAPVVEMPATGSPADPLPSIDLVELAAAVAGDVDDLVRKSFVRGEPLELPGVPLADDLVIHLSGRAGGAEIAYGRTCALDLRSNPTLAPPHLYFSRIVKWAAAPAPVTTPQRTGGLAFAARDGSAIFLDGSAGAGGPLVSGVDHFDPRQGAWDAFSGADFTPRAGAVVAALGDGSALVIGGISNDVMVPSFEHIDPLARPVPLVARDQNGLQLVDHAAATLASGHIIVMGGRTGTPPALSVSGDVWELSEAVDGSIDPPLMIDQKLAVPRAEHTLTRLSDDLGARVLVAGGVDAAGAPVAPAELYRPQQQRFDAPAEFSAAMKVPRHRHLAVRMPDSSVLIVGGLDANGATVARLELFSVDGGFQEVGELPGGLIDFTATPLPDGRVLLAGGRASPGGPPLRNVFIARLDPTDGSVDVGETDPLATARAGHQAVLLCDGTVLLVGGTDASDAAAERYNPPSIGRR
jgi:hypothetical protein